MSTDLGAHVLIILNKLCTLDIKGYEYGAFPYGHPPFYFIKSKFVCNGQILWDSILAEVHPGYSEGCGMTIQRSQVSILSNSDIEDSLCLHSFYFFKLYGQKQLLY